ncbi:MAG: winged helix-turn-helix domain-containing protein [Thermoproteus sp. AZ2]|uniref:Winged helix-turn-helix domain-containing protein n=1 Tax=Thermoproteus sp. AZ2 TaxID=1609232 RepID=A0ACC6V281_9CREN
MEITADVLAVLEKGCINPTRLAAEANLAYDRLAKLLEALKSRGLVELSPGEVCISRRGLEFLAEYRRWRSFLESFGL